MKEDGALVHTDCFVVSHSKVVEGIVRYVVVAVGTMYTFAYALYTLLLTPRTLAVREDIENTPLQLKVYAVGELIAQIGSLAGLLLFLALLIRFFVQLGTGEPVRCVLHLLEGNIFIDRMLSPLGPRWKNVQSNFS
jgi:Ca2+-transporting ATPase